MAEVVTTRFAPSPTGRLHLGNLRTALFNYLFARREEGRFRLRLEDTDRARNAEGLAQWLLDDLSWLGLQWDGRPAYQSDYAARHAHLIQQLIDARRAYRCFCSQSRLAELRRGQRAEGHAPRYDGACAGLSDAEVDRRLQAGERAAVRFRVPAGRSLIIDDLVRGEVRFSTTDIGDFVIARADGSASFFFCNAVDDALDGISHVLRGDDHLSNTPRQLLVLEALGLKPPAYGHLPLVVDADGSPLSKRRGAPTLADLRALGYLPEAINNFLAHLGHAGPAREVLSLTALAEQFDLSRISLSAPRFDPEQLLYWQRQALETLSPPAFSDWVRGAWQGWPEDADVNAFAAWIRPNTRLWPDVQAWAAVVYGEVEPDAPAREALLGAPSGFLDHLEAALTESGGDWPTMVSELKTRTGASGKRLFLPLRSALTGRTRGPELAGLLALMPAPRLRRRLADVRRSLADAAAHRSG